MKAEDALLKVVIHSANIFEINSLWFRSIQSMVAGYKAKIRQKDMVEAIGSAHGNQKAEREEMARDKINPFRICLQ